MVVTIDCKDTINCKVIMVVTIDCKDTINFKVIIVFYPELMRNLI